MTELREGGSFTIMSSLKLQGSNLLRDLDLSSTTDAARGQTKIHQRSDAFVEELGLQENDTDQVGAHIACLVFDNRACRQRPELREGGSFTIMSSLKLQGSNLLRDLDLSSTTDAARGQTKVHQRSDAFVEELGLQEDDTDHVCARIACLVLDNKTCRQ